MKQYSMRRKDKEITDEKEINALLKEAPVCRLGLSDNDFPYVVPMNFVYEDRVFYFHCAQKGKKIQILQVNPKVCIEIDSDHSVIIPNNLLQTTMAYRSVIAFGTASMIIDLEEKNKVLQRLMEKYTQQSVFIPEKMLKQTGIFKVSVSSITAKGSRS